jgi:hypothetical protein
MDAAEMTGCVASPSTMVFARQSSLGARLPSIHASCGATPSPCTARCMASIEAWKMLIRSISSTLAEAMDQAMARSLMRAASTSRRSAVRTLESASPLMRRFLSRITAAAYTGPASGPRPASSTPQTSTLSMSFVQHA